MWCRPHLLLCTNIHDIVIKMWKKGNFCGLKRSAEKHPGPFCCYEMGNIITWHLLLSITSSCEMSLADTLAHFPLRFVCQEAHSIYWETLQRQKLQEADFFFFSATVIAVQWYPPVLWHTESHTVTLCTVCFRPQPAVRSHRQKAWIQPVDIQLIIIALFLSFYGFCCLSEAARVACGRLLCGRISCK